MGFGTPAHLIQRQVIGISGRSEFSQNQTVGGLLNFKREVNLHPGREGERKKRHINGIQAFGFCRLNLSRVLLD